MHLTWVEYIWNDGASPTKGLRSKAKAVKCATVRGEPMLRIEDVPDWGFDGSSTCQAPGDDSDVGLVPVALFRNPLRRGSFLAVCETTKSDGSPHESNTRSILRNTLEDQGGKYLEPWAGFEQEYVLVNGGVVESDIVPLGWPDVGEPGPQGPYYCGVGHGLVAGRSVAYRHADACVDAGISIYGTNAEVMLGQWEFQIGPTDQVSPQNNVLNMSDHLIAARWLLQAIAESQLVGVSYDPKPVFGDWNGSGMHTNFSTRKIRDESTRSDAVDRLFQVLKDRHANHIVDYGFGNEYRLTGLHETCPISDFRVGESDRGASIRLPREQGGNLKPYIEDRRPAANADPYVVSSLLVSAALKSESMATSEVGNTSE